MKLKIESDGTVAGTQVLTESGEPVQGVTCLRFRIHSKEELARVTMELNGVPIKFVGDVKVKGIDPAKEPVKAA